MAKTAPALPEGLPPHVIAECEADPSMIGWWTRWAAVGIAKDARRDAHRAWSAAEIAYRECRAAAAANVGHAIPSNTCGCGDCPAVMQAAIDSYVASHAAVASAIEEFKS